MHNIVDYRYENMPFKSATSFSDLFDNPQPFDSNKPSKPVHEWIGSYLFVREPRQSFDVTVKPEVAADIAANMLRIEYDRIHFEIVRHDNGKALVIASYSQILGSRWLAYIDATTIPAKETEQ